MTRFEPKAIERIESLKGLPVAVYHDAVGLRYQRIPRTKLLPGQQLQPPSTLKMRAYYSNYENRGYLHPLVRDRLTAADPNFARLYRFARPMDQPSKPVFPLRRIPNELRQERLLPS